MSIPQITTPGPARTMLPDVYIEAWDRFFTEFPDVIAAMNALGVSIAGDFVGASTTGMAIGLGAKSFTATAGLSWQPGQPLLLASASGPTNWMSGPATAYNPVDGATTMQVTSVGGSGTKSDWVISVVPAGAAPPPRGHLSGLALSVAGASSTFGIAAGECTDSTGAVRIVQGAAITKTTAAWAVGSGAGALDIGTIANNTGYHVHKIYRPDTGVDDAVLSMAPGKAGVVTMTIASPGVVTWADHGLKAGAPVVFTTTGALPTGITAGTRYFVKTVVSSDTFQIAATAGGTSINTTGSQSGVHTCTSNPVLPANYTVFRRIDWVLTDGSAQPRKRSQVGDEVLWDAPVGDLSAVTVGVAGLVVPLTVPTGVKAEALMNALMLSNTATVALLVHARDQANQVISTPSGNAQLFCQVNNQAVTAQLRARTNASGEVRAVSNASAQTCALSLVTQGYVDRRGRDD